MLRALRTFVPLAMAGCSFLAIAQPAEAQQAARSPAGSPQRAAAARQDAEGTRRAAPTSQNATGAQRAGLAYLVSKQGEDGSWEGNVANTSMAVLALLRSGHKPGDGKYGAKLAQAIDFLVTQAENKDSAIYSAKSGFPGGLTPGQLPVDPKKLLDELGKGVGGFPQPGGAGGAGGAGGGARGGAGGAGGRGGAGGAGGAGGGSGVGAGGSGDYGADLRQAGAELQSALSKAKTPAARAKVMEAYAEKMKSLSSSAFPGGLSGSMPGITQMKLGRDVDLYAATLALAEVAQQSAGQSESSGDRVRPALDKLVAAMQAAQRDSGAWTDDGMYTVLTNGLAAAAIHRAYQAGAQVDPDVLKRSIAPREMPQMAMNRLYNSAARIAALSAAAESLKLKRPNLGESGGGGGSFRLSRAEAAALQRELSTLQSQTLAKLDAPDFNLSLHAIGGEELLAYLFIGDSLAQSGSVSPFFSRVVTSSVLKDQNADGSWLGKHCVTDRTFCTSAAVMGLNR